MNSDGLHLTSEGYRVVFDSLKKLILSSWAELDPESMAMPTPQSVDVLGLNPTMHVILTLPAGPRSTQRIRERFWVPILATKAVEREMNCEPSM